MGIYYALILISLHYAMNPNKLLRFANMFYSLAAGEDLPEDSSDLKTILKNIENLETYAARKKYAEKNLSHLSSGSSRIVYLTSDKTIVKLAKNDKGLAQNKVESNPEMKSKYLNKIISRAQNDVWLETHFLEKITEKQFESMTDIRFDDFGDSIRYGLKKISINSDVDKPENFDEVSKSDIYKEIKEIGEKFKLLPGDIARISSWGEKDGQPVLIDAGLTRDIFDEYYEDSTS
jgi:hypothetical protein